MTTVTETPPKKAQTDIVELEPVHEAGLARLYTDHFGAWAYGRFALRREWQFSTTPWSTELPTQTLVAVTDSGTVGLMTSSPLPLRTAQGRVLAVSTGDLAVDPGHPVLALQLSRGMAAFGPLLNAGASPLAERISRAAGSVVVPLSRATFVFPLRRTGAFRRALRRRLPAWLCRMIEPSCASWASRLLAPSDAPRPQPIPTRPSDTSPEPLRTFDAAYDDLWAEFAARYPWGIDKSSAYMKWRYLDVPAGTIRVWGVRRSERLDAIVITGICTELDHERRPGGTTGEILELIARDPDDHDLVASCLVHALTVLDRACVDTVRATGLCTAYHEPLRQLGFAVDEGARHQIAVHLPGQDLGPDDAWYVSAGDGDQLYATLL